MHTTQISVWLFSTLISLGVSDKLNDNYFPKDFLFGVATASHQIEGGWRDDGKGENIWNRLEHEKPNLIKDKNNGDIACDSYHKYKEDVALLRELGADHYRFSISWSRILPMGFNVHINSDGVNYYKNLIQELKKNHIEPLVTLFHWDTPQPLEDLGGFANDLIVKWYTDYAKLCFELFGDSVKYWLTFNEPKQICNEGYGTGTKAPAKLSGGLGEYICAHNLLKAHAKAWHIYNSTYRSAQKGKVGITIGSDWFQSQMGNATIEDESVEIKRQFTFGWYANPIFYGDYPDVMKKMIASRSKEQGFPTSRLPEFTEEEKTYLKGTFDYLGVNLYTASIVHEANFMIGDISWKADSRSYTYQSNEWPDSASEWLRVAPWSMRHQPKWIADTYGNPPMIITENGWSDNGTTLQDDRRISYLQQYLSNLRDAMMEDGVNVFGYTVWSLMDNFEWMNGYTQKFGLYYVDFNDPNRTRIPKKSAEYVKQLFWTKCIVDKCK